MIPAFHPLLGGTWDVGGVTAPLFMPVAVRWAICCPLGRVVMGRSEILLSGLWVLRTSLASPALSVSAGFRGTEQGGILRSVFLPLPDPHCPFPACPLEVREPEAVFPRL